MRIRCVPLFFESVGFIQQCVGAFYDLEGFVRNLFTPRAIFEQSIGLAY